MGKRYYCEVCDKYFADNLTNRKNHVKGVVHQRNRKLHYDACRDSAAVLADESMKIPCRQFGLTGDCRFGATCRFSHLVAETRCQLEKQAEADRLNAQKKFEEKHKNMPSFEDWLRKYEAEQNKDEPETEKFAIPDFTLPLILQSFPNLPPSLIPPTKADILHSLSNDWG